MLQCIVGLVVGFVLVIALLGVAACMLSSQISRKGKGWER